MKLHSIKLFSATMLLTLLAACGGDKTASSPAQEAPKAEPVATQGQVYKVGIEAPYPPYVQLGEKGEYVGFDVDVLNEIAKREGFGLAWQPAPWDGIYELLNDKTLDIVASGGFDTPERRAKYAFTQPYNTETIVLITKDATAKTFNHARGKRISYVAGSAEEGIVRELTGSQELDKDLGNETSWLSIKRLVQGQADFAIDTSSVYGHYAKQYPEQKLYAIQQNNAETNNVAFAVKQDNAELLVKLNKGLNAIKTDGTYDKLKAKWFASTTAQ